MSVMHVYVSSVVYVSVGSCLVHVCCRWSMCLVLGIYDALALNLCAGAFTWVLLTKKCFCFSVCPHLKPLEPEDHTFDKGKFRIYS